jgi:phage antirepressor YoqD-like protein
MVEKELYELITATQITLTYKDDFKPERKFPNKMGFVPAVLFENETEMAQLHASSELEAIEPYMKFYHDVMVHAGSSSELHSTAKLVVRARDLNRFLEQNFTQQEIDEKRLRFKNKDVLFFESGDPSITSVGSNIYQEGADIIQAEAPLGDTTTLLEFIFLNIVDVSEIPEWAFGGAIGSSKASVSEQSAPLVHKVKRKRAMVESGWALLGRMMLKTVLNTTTRVEVRWSDLAMRDLKSEAEAFRNFTEALLALNDGQAVSKTTMNRILMKLLPEILPYNLDEDSTESDMVEAEVQAKLAQAIEFAEALGTDDENDEEEDDRQTGIDAVE